MGVFDSAGEGPKAAVTPQYGLRRDALSPVETLAQSVSTIAPSTSPTLTVPLVFGLCGVGTCFAYGIAMGVIVLVALCIAVFARSSASPGSLYTYAHQTLPPAWGAATAWALFFAYVMTAASVVGGFVNYGYVLLELAVGAKAHAAPAVLLAVVDVLVAIAIAYRDVRLSTRLMLWIEAVSVLLIAVVVAITLARHGVHLDWRQVRLEGTSITQVRLGVVLALFSFVGFESATTLGAEARDPLRSIPRAIVLSAVLAGVFFIVCSYGTVLGFAGTGQNLAESTAPFRLLSARAGVAWIGPVIDVGVLVSMFAATLACIVAAARVMLLMAHQGLTNRRLSQTHARHESPARASVVAGVLALVPPAACLLRGVSGMDIYGYMGALAVFGFLTAYAIVAVAMVQFLRRRGGMTAGRTVLGVAAVLAMVAAMLGTLFPVPPAPYKFFPAIYAAYLAGGMVWYVIARRRDARG